MTRLRDYQTFVTIVEVGSLSGAADQLHRSVSAVSKQLSRFEADLGICLVQRSTHALAVTEAGQRFYLRCKAILADIREAESALTDANDTHVGTLRISLPEVLINAGIMMLLTEFAGQHPRIRFDVKVSNQLDNLEMEGLDAAFRIAALPDSRLTAVELGEVQTRICATPAYLNQFGTPSDLAELMTQHRLLLPDFVNLSEQVRRLFPAEERPFIDVQKAHRLNSENALLAALHAGLGIGFVLDIVADPAFRKGTLVRLLPELMLPSQPVNLVFRHAPPMPARWIAFKTFMASHFKTLLL